MASLAVSVFLVSIHCVLKQCRHTIARLLGSLFLVPTPCVLKQCRHPMDRLFVSMFLVFMHCVPTHGSMRMMKIVYKPYGLQMCVELCTDTGNLFAFIVEDLSCRRIQRNEPSNVENNSTCPATKKLMNNCGCLRTISKGVCNSLAQLTTEIKHHGHCDCKILHRACEKGKLQKVRNILSQRPVCINCRGIYGRTPVMSAAREGQTSVFIYLISQGCDVSAVNDYKNNVLYEACRGGSIDIVKKLVVEEKMDVHSRYSYGRTPLITAARYCHKDLFDFLVMKGSNVTAVDNHNGNILHYVCANGCLELLKYVLSQGIFDIECTGYNGLTPVMMAVDKGHFEIVKFLVSKGCNISAVGERKNNILHMACTVGHVDLVKYILSQNRIDIDSRNIVGRTSLMKAAAFGQREIFDLLISKGSKPRVVDAQNNTLLHVACLGGSVEMVSHILSQNLFGIESRGFEGRTPVMIAVEKGQREVFDFLRSEGCNLTAVDNAKNNIIHLACKGGHVDMLKYLVTLGVVDMKERNMYGQTPTIVAELYGHKAITTVLKTNL